MPQVIVELTQARKFEVEGAGRPMLFRGGSTLVMDLGSASIQYAITKEIGSASREQRTRAYLAEAFADPVRALQMGPARDEPFALMHGFGVEP